MIIILLTLTASGQKDMLRLKNSNVICGAERLDHYLPKLQDIEVGLVGNKSSRVGDMHLLDVLLSKGINVTIVFCPEHGFRGEGEAGELIDDHLDSKTGIPVVSVYGSKKKPAEKDLLGIDLLVFDIQDVGARFYTYISTLHYIMEAAAEQGIELLVLDRPNPNGFYVDGPIREESLKSFVGMHPIPVVHGMTIGEYAKMINGEKWLNNGVQCDLEVVGCINYDRMTEYILPVIPSPNLPNQTSVYLYPSLCFFEGTIVSIGRGTIVPFQIYGHPDYPGEFKFRPESIEGASMNPKWKNQTCSGQDLRRSGIIDLFQEPGLHLEYLIDAYNQLGKPENFFTKYFDTLAGTKRIRAMIIEGYSADEIRATWVDDVRKFQKLRENYLMY